MTAADQAREELILAALNLQTNRLYADLNPGGAHNDAQAEMDMERLDAAAWAFTSADAEARS